MANSVDPDQTAPMGAVFSGSTLFASILNLSAMLGNYLQQMTSADDIFRCFFFLGAFRVKYLKFQLQSQFQRFFNQTLCIFSHMKDIKHIRRDFGLVTWAMPQGSDLGVPWGGVWGVNFFFKIQPDLVCELRA